jgi:hypothetical protein
MRDLGNLGESCFTTWCNQAFITSNSSKIENSSKIGRSTIDRHGWDFYLEFPSEDHPNIPLDMQPAALECKVQVKSTDQRRKSKQIELSNLRRLIQTPQPAFFCFIKFDGNLEPVSAYLVHVDESIIKRTLKALQQADFSEQRSRINKKTININFNDSHKIDPLNGVSLKKAILSHVKHGLEKYTAEKYKLLSSLGFEDGSVHIEFETENVDSLNDLFLGITSEISIRNLMATQYRFNTQYPSSFLDIEQGKLSIPDLPVFTEGKITFKEHLFSHRISFPCKVYDSPLKKFLPQEMFKFNVKGEFFNCIVQPFINQAKFSLLFPENRQLGINTAINIVKLLLMMLNSTKKIIVEIDCAKFPQPISINISSTTLNSSPYKTSANTIEELNQELECLEKVKFICSFFEIEDTVSITRYEINQSNKIIESINTMYDLVNNKIKNFQNSEGVMYCEFGIENEESLLKENFNNIICLYQHFSKIGNYYVGIIFGLIGKANKENDKYSLTVENLSIERNFVVESHQIKDQKLLEEQFSLTLNKINQKYSQDNYAIIKMFE